MMGCAVPEGPSVAVLSPIKAVGIVCQTKPKPTGPGGFLLGVRSCEKVVLQLCARLLKNVPYVCGVGEGSSSTTSSGACTRFSQGSAKVCAQNTNPHVIAHHGVLPRTGPSVR